MDNKSIIEAISEYQYVSFDIFDTLLIRSVLKPEDIFTKIDEDHKFGTLNFKEYRINAFIKACQLYENETDYMRGVESTPALPGYNLYAN